MLNLALFSVLWIIIVFENNSPGKYRKVFEEKMHDNKDHNELYPISLSSFILSFHIFFTLHSVLNSGMMYCPPWQLLSLSYFTFSNCDPLFAFNTPIPSLLPSHFHLFSFRFYEYSVLFPFPRLISALSNKAPIQADRSSVACGWRGSWQTAPRP